MVANRTVCSEVRSGGCECSDIEVLTLKSIDRNRARACEQPDSSPVRLSKFLPSIDHRNSNFLLPSSVLLYPLE